MTDSLKHVATVLLSFATLALATSTGWSDEITFRPDPFGNPGTTFSISGFDPGPGSLLVQQQIPAQAVVGGADINVVFQSQLSNLLPATFVPGLGTSFQILTLVHTRVKSIAVSPIDFFFTNPTTPGPNLVELRYHDLAVPINEKTGAGYNTPADPVILSGHVIEIDGAASIHPLVPPMPLDQSGTGPADVDTLTANGAAILRILVDYVNPLFFPDPNTILKELLLSTQTATPFAQVTPNMGVFFTGDSRDIGVLNGFSGPDVLVQSDPNISITAQAVPEPGSVALLILGLGGIGARRLFRRKSR